MAVKNVTMTCDWCEDETQVEFSPDDEVLFRDVPPDVSWYRLEHDGEEFDFCSKDCLLSHL